MRVFGSSAGNPWASTLRNLQWFSKKVQEGASFNQNEARSLYRGDSGLRSIRPFGATRQMPSSSPRDESVWEAPLKGRWRGAPRTRRAIWKGRRVQPKLRFLSYWQCFRKCPWEAIAQEECWDLGNSGASGNKASIPPFWPSRSCNLSFRWWRRMRMTPLDPAFPSKWLWLRTRFFWLTNLASS